MINGLPPEFKLLDENGKTVGFKKFNNDKGEWRTSEKGNIWYLNHRINYKKMRQWTGYFDIHEEKIYFGDELKKWDHIAIVDIYGGLIGAKDPKKAYIWTSIQFKDMELVK